MNTVTVYAKSLGVLANQIRHYERMGYQLCTIYSQLTWYLSRTYYAHLIYWPPPPSLSFRIGPISERGPAKPSIDITPNDLALVELVIGEQTMLVLTDIQQCLLSVAPVDAAGNPGKIDGQPAWSVSNPDVLALTVNEDGLSALVATTGKLGTCQVSVKADADLGEGVKEITGVLDVEVQGSEAVNLNITAGTPENKP